MAAELPDKIQELESPFAEIVARCIVKKAPERAQRVEELISILRNSNKAFAKPMADNQAVATSLTQMHGKDKQKQPAISAPNANPEKNTDNIPKSTFYVLEDDVKGNDNKKDRKKYYVIPLSIAAFLVAAVFLFFFIQQQPGNKPDIPQLVIQPVVKTDSATTTMHDTSIAAKNIIPPSPPAKDSVQKTVARDAGISTKTDNAAKKELSKNERQRMKKESLPDRSSHKAAGVANDTYVLELNASLDCTIKVNSINYGEVRNGGKLKVWLQSGTYQIKAFNTSDNAEIYSKTIQVGTTELGTVGHIRIIALPSIKP
jgi:hypothetical protein